MIRKLELDCFIRPVTQLRESIRVHPGSEAPADQYVVDEFTIRRTEHTVAEGQLAGGGEKGFGMKL